MNNFQKSFGLAALIYIATVSLLFSVLLYMQPDGQWAEEHVFLLLLLGPLAAMLTHSSIFGVVLLSFLVFPFWVGVLADSKRRWAWIASALCIWLIVGGVVSRTFV